MIPSMNTACRVAVLGARGMLGTDLVPALRDAGCQVSGYDLPDWDITDPAAVAEAVAPVTAVINCAAYTNVDGAETHTDTARAVNAIAPAVLGRCAAERGVHVIHISTDFVFDGTLDRPYREDDPPNPINMYGRTKLEGEQGLLAGGCSCLIMRVQWTYGRGGRHFVSKFLDRVRSGGELLMVSDQIGSPTWTRDVAAALVELLNRRCTGLFHYAADGYATRFEVAQAILELSGSHDRSLRPCATSDFPAPARRPLNSRFDCRRLDGLGGIRRPPWRESLAAFLREAGENG